MTGPNWTTVHVFVSSTFNDMHAERDYLVKVVFPRVRQWCEQRKIRFFYVDLRWGVTELDATYNQRVVDICLRGIDECRPFFISFIGQRYGEIIPREYVSTETLERYPGLRERIGSASLTELEIWHSILKPFREKDNKQNPENLSLFYLREPSYLSALPSDMQQLKRIYTDTAEENLMLKNTLTAKLNQLQDSILASGHIVRHYDARWEPNLTTPELRIPLKCPFKVKKNQEHWRFLWKHYVNINVPDLDVTSPSELAVKAQVYNSRLIQGRLTDFLCNGRTLGDVIFEDLTKAIGACYSDRVIISPKSDLERELDQHAELMQTVTESFVKRPRDFDFINGYVKDKSNQVLAITAPSGWGKTTLLARWISLRQNRTETQSQEERETLYFRFIGVGERSTKVPMLLRSLMEEFNANGTLQDDPVQLPDDPRELSERFMNYIAKAGSSKKIIIVLDALNQLDTGLTNLGWLPQRLPANVKLIVSIRTGYEEGDNLVKRWLKTPYIQVHSLKGFQQRSDRYKLIQNYLSQGLKQLDQHLIQKLVSTSGANNPLYLKVALNELRIFGSFYGLAQKIELELGTTPITAFEGVLKRLETEPSYAAIDTTRLAPMMFGFLVHAQGGMPEGLLVKLIIDGLQLERDRADDVQGCIRMLFNQLREYLTVKEGRYDFFYEAFLLAAKARYIDPNTLLHSRRAEEWHQAIVSYCADWTELDSHTQQYALRWLVPHCLLSAQPWIAACVLSDFLYHFTALKRLGPNFVSEVLPNFRQTIDLLQIRTGDHASATAYEKWYRFYRSCAWRIRRCRAPRKPHIELLQQSIGDPNVGKQAKDWLQNNSVDSFWMKAVRSERGEFNLATRGTWWLHPDGKRILFLQRSESDVPANIEIWDLNLGTRLRELVGHTRTISALLLFPHGRRAVSTSSSDGSLRVWDLETYECSHMFRGKEPLLAHPDGHRFLAQSDDKIKLWDTETGICECEIEDSADTMCLSKDGQCLLVANKDRIRVWDFLTVECLLDIKGHRVGIERLICNPDGIRFISIASPSWDNSAREYDETFRIWSLKTGQCLHKLYHGLLRIKLELLPDGQHAVVVGGRERDQALQLWDLDNGICRLEIAPSRSEGHTAYITDLLVHPDGRRAVTNSRDGTMKVWDIREGKCLSTVCHGDDYSHIALMPDGQRILCGGRILKIVHLDKIMSIDHHTRPVRGVRVKNERAFSYGDDGTIRIWDARSGKCLRVLEGHSGAVTAAEWSSDGRRIISGGEDKTLRVWDVNTGEDIRTLQGHENTISCIAVHTDGQRVVAGEERYGNSLRVWDIETGKCLHILKGHSMNGINYVALQRNGLFAISAGGEFNAGTGYDNGPRIWNLDTGVCVQLLEEPEGHWVNAVAITDDGHRAISVGDAHNILKVWDVSTARCLHTLKGHPGSEGNYSGYTGKNLLATDAAGKRAVVTGGYSDGTIKVWDLEAGVCLNTLRQGKGFEGYSSIEGLAMQDSLAVVSSNDGLLEVWDVDRGVLETSWIEESNFTCCAFDGEVIAAGGYAGQVYLFKLNRN